MSIKLGSFKRKLWCFSKMGPHLISRQHPDQTAWSHVALALTLFRMAIQPRRGRLRPSTWFQWQFVPTRTVENGGVVWKKRKRNRHVWIGFRLSRGEICLTGMWLLHCLLKLPLLVLCGEWHERCSCIIKGAHVSQQKANTYRKIPGEHLPHFHLKLGYVKRQSNQALNVSFSEFTSLGKRQRGTLAFSL